MKRSKLGLKALGLCAIVVGLMVCLGATAAQAETGAKWTWKNGASSGEFTNTLEAKTTLTVVGGSAQLLIAGSTVGVKCTTAAIAASGTGNGKLAGGGLILLGKVVFGGCLLTSSGVVNTKCKTTSPSGLETVETEAGTGELKLHELANKTKDDTTLFKPDTGTVLAHIVSVEGCPIAEEIIVEGELVLYEADGTGRNLKVTHRVTEFPGLQLMTVGAAKATIDGSADVTLAETHLGFEWAAIPN
jgi:hypothetical protein